MGASNPKLEGGVESPQGIYETSTKKVHALGTRGYIGDRVFYYAKNAGAAIDRGTVCVDPAVVTNHKSVAWASGGAAGATSVTLTLGATSAAENLYEDGYLIGIDNSSGDASGQLRIVESHPSASSSGTVTVTLKDAIESAFSTSDEVSLIPNKFGGVTTSTGAAVDLVVGVPQFDVPAGSTTAQYFWLQTWGPAAVAGDGSAFTAGSPVTLATATTADAGQMTLLVLDLDATADATALPVIGHVIDGGDTSDADHRLVDLRINP